MATQEEIKAPSTSSRKKMGKARAMRGIFYAGGLVVAVLTLQDVVVFPKLMLVLGLYVAGYFFACHERRTRLPG